MKTKPNVLLLAGLLLVSSFGWGQSSKLSPDLQGYSGSGVRVIVQYSQPPCTGLGCVLNLVGNVVGQLPLLNAVVTVVDGTGLLQLESDPNVIYVSRTGLSICF